MATLPAIRDAVDFAILEADGGRVDVYGMPDRLRAGERLCTRPDAGQQVIVHVRPIVLAEGYACLTCGRRTDTVPLEEPDEHAA